MQLTAKPVGGVRVEDGAAVPLAEAENCRIESFPLLGFSMT
jgi:hypothetical protein